MDRPLGKELILIRTSDLLFNQHITLKRYIAITLITIQLISLIISFILGLTTTEPIEGIAAKICLAINLTCLALIIIFSVLEDIVWKRSKDELCNKFSTDLDFLLKEVTDEISSGTETIQKQ